MSNMFGSRATAATTDEENAIVPPDTIPAESEVTLNSKVLMFVLIVSVATSVICGLAPALHTSRRDLADSLQEVGRGLAGATRQARAS
jgi:hypothetical protein